MSLADTPSSSYYAVVFTSRRTDADPAGYEETARRMERLAARQPGFLGVEGVRDKDGVGITVSYWSSLEAVHAWGRHAEHLVAQASGRECWCEEYRLRVCHVEAETIFPDSR